MNMESCRHTGALVDVVSCVICEFRIDIITLILAPLLATDLSCYFSQNQS